MPAFGAMTQELTITRRGATTDAEGRAAAASAAATVKGLVVELSGTEVAQGEALGQETTAQAIAPLGTDVRAQDDLTVTYPASGLERTYRVVAVHDAVRALLIDLHRDGA
jgi:hypothetical protein